MRTFATLPSLIIHTSLAFATRLVFRLHPVQQGEPFGGRVIKNRDVFCLFERKRAAAQESTLLVREARQLVENFG